MLSNGNVVIFVAGVSLDGKGKQISWPAFWGRGEWLCFLMCQQTHGWSTCTLASPDLLRSMSSHFLPHKALPSPTNSRCWWPPLFLPGHSAPARPPSPISLNTLSTLETSTVLILLISPNTSSWGYLPCFSISWTTWPITPIAHQWPCLNCTILENPICGL